MQVKQLKIKNFRCFSDFEIAFENNLSVISGENGTGKSSILEAIHYLCYMKSFRTYSPKDLIKFESDNFFIKASFYGDEIINNLQIGFSQGKRIVKLNKKNINSFKDLMDYYRVITLTEDDLWLIKGGPDIRRSFLDQAILLYDHTFLSKIKDFKKVLEQRNRLLQNDFVSNELYDLWTTQLWERSISIQQLRKKTIEAYEIKINNILKKTFKNENITISFVYKAKNINLQDNFHDFMKMTRRLWIGVLVFFIFSSISISEANSHSMFNSAEKFTGGYRVQVATLPEFPNVGENSQVLLRVTDADFNEVDIFQGEHFASRKLLMHRRNPNGRVVSKHCCESTGILRLCDVVQLRP